MIASRYVKAENWTAAIDVLFEGAVALLRAGQGGSGGDLGCYLLDVYDKAEVPVGGEGKGLWNPGRFWGGRWEAEEVDRLKISR